MLSIYIHWPLLICHQGEQGCDNRKPINSLWSHKINLSIYEICEPIHMQISYDVWRNNRIGRRKYKSLCWHTVATNSNCLHEFLMRFSKNLHSILLSSYGWGITLFLMQLVPLVLPKLRHHKLLIVMPTYWVRIRWTFLTIEQPCKENLIRFRIGVDQDN